MPLSALTPAPVRTKTRSVEEMGSIVKSVCALCLSGAETSAKCLEPSFSAISVAQRLPSHKDRLRRILIADREELR